MQVIASCNSLTQEMNAQYSPLVSKCVLNTFNLQPFDYGIDVELAMHVE
jgi:hypothetical protein